MPFVVVGEVADASGELPFQFPIRLSSRLVIVEHAVDTSIPVQHIYSFGNIGGRIEDDVILPVKVGQVKDSPSCPRIQGISLSLLPVAEYG